MLASFATAEQYRCAYDTDLYVGRLQALLDRASREIAAELRAAGIDYGEPADEFAADLADVACSMVHRAVDAGGDMPGGVTQVSQGAVGFTKTYSFANPYGDMFMTKAERRRLGIGQARAGFASPFARKGA